MDLPPELAGLVLAELSDDNPALYACSLVCRAWAALSRRHLFEQVYLDFCGKADTRSPVDAAEYGPWATIDGASFGAITINEEAQLDEVQVDDDGGGDEDGGEELDAEVSGDSDEDASDEEAPNGDFNGDEGGGASQAGDASDDAESYLEDRKFVFKRPSPERAWTFLDLFASPYCTFRPYIRTLMVQRLAPADAATGTDPPAALLRTFAVLPAIHTLGFSDTGLSDAVVAAITADYSRISTLMLRALRLPTDIWALATSLPALATLEIPDVEWPPAPASPTPLALATLVATSSELARLAADLAARPVLHLSVRALAIDHLLLADIAPLAALYPRLGPIADLQVEFEDTLCTAPLPAAFAAVDLAAHGALALLTLTNDDNESGPDLVEGLPALAARAPPGLAELVVDVALVAGDAAGLGWAAADAALAPRAGLRRVEIAVRVEAWTKRRVRAGLAREIRALMPGLDRRGILELEVERQ